MLVYMLFVLIIFLLLVLSTPVEWIDNAKVPPSVVVFTALVMALIFPLIPFILAIGMFMAKPAGNGKMQR